MGTIKWILIVSAILLGGWLLDRLLLACEARGWIYWRKKSPSRSSIGNAVMELHSIFEPSKKHVIEERRGEKTEIDEEGDPPEPLRAP